MSDRHSLQIILAFLGSNIFIPINTSEARIATLRCYVSLILHFNSFHFFLSLSIGLDLLNLVKSVLNHITHSRLCLFESVVHFEVLHKFAFNFIALSYLFALFVVGNKHVVVGVVLFGEN